MKEAFDIINETLRDIEETENKIASINRADRKREFFVLSIALILFIVAIALIIYAAFFMDFTIRNKTIPSQSQL